MRGINLLQLCKLNLRTLTFQYGVGGSEKRELQTIEGSADKWKQLGISLSHKDLDVVGHPLLDDLWKWHLEGGAPKKLANTGQIAMYMSFAHRDEAGQLVTRCAAIDTDLFRSKDGLEPFSNDNETSRFRFLERSRDIHDRIGVPFLWAFSRSYGIHQWYFFEEDIPLPEAWGFVTDIRKRQRDEGLYGEITDADLENKADPRPKMANPQDIASAHRLLIPYSTWYPHTKFYTGTDRREPVADDFVPVFTPRSKIPERKKAKVDTPPREFDNVDIPHVAQNAHPSWQKVTTDQDRANRRSLDPMDSGVDLEGLIPCAVSMLANRIEVPDGQWHNFNFLVAQSIGAMNKDAKDDALIQTTEVLNAIGEFGGYPEDNEEAFRTTVNSAFRALQKGIPPACKKVDVARANCCPIHCNMIRGGYRAVQSLVPESQRPRIWKRQYTDPLYIKVKGDRYVSICIPAFLLPEYQNEDFTDPHNMRELYIDLHDRELMKYDRFAAAMSSMGVKNIDKYDVEQLLTIFPSGKEFGQYMNQMVIGQAEPVPDPTPLFRDEFLKLLGRSISRGGVMAMDFEPEKDHPARIWLSGTGTRHIAVLYSTLHSIAVELMRRAGGISADAVVEHYLEYVLKGAVRLEESSIHYIDLNWAMNARYIPLESGQQHSLEAKFTKQQGEMKVVAMMDRHIKKKDEITHDE